MSIVNSMETIRDWLSQCVCPLVGLKLPCDAAVDEGYPYELVHPAAFSMFVPTADRLPSGVKAPIPSVCVQLQSGEDRLIDHIRTYKVRLYFSAWDPGLHGKDTFFPTGNGDYVQKASKTYAKNGEGWRDAWSFVDTALREIEGAEYIGNLRILKESGILYGPVTEQDSIADFYPYWFAWAEFSVEEGLSRSTRAYREYL